MALDSGAGIVATTLGGTALVSVAAGEPIALGDFGWFTLFALLGVIARHAFDASQDRRLARSAAVSPRYLPRLDWLGLLYDAFTAPLLGSLGWVAASTLLPVLFARFHIAVMIDGRVLAIMAMSSGFVGAQWVRYIWALAQRLAARLTGGGK